MESFQEILFVDRIFGSVVCNILIFLYLVWDQNYYGFIKDSFNIKHMRKKK